MNRPDILRSIIVGMLPSFAYAHSGIGAVGFMHGFVHPFGGWDHLCALLATALLPVTGLAFCLGVQMLTRDHAVRFSGAGIVLFGLYLSVV